MAKRRQASKLSPAEQLDQGVGAMMAERDAPLPRVNSNIAALLQIAAELRDLPRTEFKTRLKTQLRKAAASGSAGASTRIATPYLMIRGAADAIEFYKRAFSAVELNRMVDPTGHIAHAEIKIADAPIMIAEEAVEYHNLSPESLGGSSTQIRVYVDDVDAVARQAVAAGARILEPVQDYSYGDRGGKFADPYGHVWMIATPIREVSPTELKQIWETEQQQRAESAKPSVDPIPEGFHSITPYLQVYGASSLIEFLKQAFGAEEILRVNQPDGTIGHAQMKVAGSIIELADASDQFKPNPTGIWLFVDDVDRVYEQAMKVGATSIHGPMDQEYGNREASIKDPFGNNWYIARRLPDTQPWAEELRSVTPYLHPIGSDKLIEFLKNAFGADEIERHEGGGIIHHAQIRIGDSIIAIGEAHGQFQPMPPALHLYVKDTDATYARAVRAGATSMYAPSDAPYGDRAAGVTDPFGNVWYIATHQDPEKLRELVERSKEPAPEPARAPASIMPFMYVEDAAAAADYYKRIFEASELNREAQPDGTVTHVILTIGGNSVMLRNATTPDIADYVAKGYARTPGQLGGTPLHLYVHVPDADAAFQRAVDSGAVIVDPMEDKEWGDRCGGVKDPFGHIWYIATALKDPPETR